MTGDGRRVDLVVIVGPLGGGRTWALLQRDRPEKTTAQEGREGPGKPSRGVQEGGKS